MELVLERVEPSEARFKSMIERILAHKANQV